MSKIGRLAGAILAETEGIFYLVGDLKEPCDFEKHGFENPGSIDAMANRYIPLKKTGDVVFQGQVLTASLEGETLAEELAGRFLIERNASVSNRLWNLIFDAEENEGKAEADADPVLFLPKSIWNIVREGVLRCV